METSTVGELERAEARVAAAPQDPAGWKAWGELLLGERRFEEAQLALRTAMQLAPRDRGVIEGVARALEGAGHQYAAWRVLERALEIDPSHCETAFRLAHLQADVGALDAACTRMADVARRAPNDVRVQSDLGNLLLASGHVERSVPHLRRALELDPHDINAWIGLGVTHEASGDDDGAERCFRRVLEFSPACGSAWYRLVAIKRHDDIATLERVIASLPETNGVDGSPLHFAVAKLHEKAGAYDSAFDHALLANAAAAVECPIERVVQSHERAKRAPLPSAATSDEALEGARRARMVFVVGLPRTGSTLTERILAGHSQACSVGEYHGISETLTELYFARLVDPDNASVERTEDLAQQYIDRLPLDEAMRQRIARGEITCVDKSLRNYLSIDWIKLLFPRATIVHTRRDPRDALLSAYFLPLHRVACATSYDFGNLQRLREAYLDVIDHWRGLDFTAIHDVWYEDLVQDHERTVRGLLDACGLPWEPGVLDFAQRGGAVLTASSNQVRSNLYSRSVGRWRAYAERLAEHLSPELMRWERSDETRAAA